MSAEKKAAVTTSLCPRLISSSAGAGSTLGPGSGPSDHDGGTTPTVRNPWRANPGSRRSLPSASGKARGAFGSPIAATNAEARADRPALAERSGGADSAASHAEAF